MRRKLGLLSASDGDRALAAALLDTMRAARGDFTLTFRLLCDGPAAARPLFAAASGRSFLHGRGEAEIEWMVKLAAGSGLVGPSLSKRRRSDQDVSTPSHRGTMVIVAPQALHDVQRVSDATDP